MTYNKWKYNDEEYKIYVDSKRVLNYILKLTSGTICNRYMKKGNEFAWDIIVPASGIRVLDKKIKAKIKQ